ncbi:MAG: trimeric intracellular cation channel family protein [Saprospiraceae bacterium]|nr:trimeric intracellular cation channel family protein [Saprospiraceae bacterium]
MTDMQYPLELAGTAAFAISGALAVRDKGQDWFGAGFTAFITAIGGGSLRDILLGSYPLVWIADVNFIYAILVGFICTLLIPGILLRLRRTLLLFDTLGIAAFTLLGTEKALHLGVQEEIAVIMGVFSAVMGGVIRDTLANEMPVIFRREIYATACLAGAIAYVVLLAAGMERQVAFLVSAALIVLIRLLSMRFHWSLPRFLG